ncbi:Peroxisomal and mitochondrial division factor 1 [Spatholobus suberectus]|nr:Peroxisomal and mitochondrial division factor 1 [Spatholobus suberectus]
MTNDGVASYIDDQYGEELATKIAELRKVLGEKECRVEFLEKEVAGLKKAKAESEVWFRDLERKIGVMETKEVEERDKRIRFEKEMRGEIDERGTEIRGLRHMISALEMDAAETISELEKQILRECDKMITSLKSSIVRLNEDVLSVFVSLKEKAVVEMTNNIHGEGKGLKLQWPVVAAGSTGVVVAAAAVIYVYYGKRG